MNSFPAGGGEAPPTAAMSLLAAVGLSLLFFAVYPSCNALADLRPTAPPIFAEWERRIPFVPAAVLPYWSINLLFFAAPFFIASRRRLRVHALRIGAATLIAGAFFIAFPQTFAWERPGVHGPLAFCFHALDGLDRPHNLFPSLHVAYATILWAAYRGLRPRWRFALRALLVVIIASTVFTFQHHVSDVTSGLALGLICLLLWPDDAPDAAPGGKVYVFPGALYAAGAAACAAAATLHPALWALAWPAFALAWVAAAYLGLGPAALRKSGGRLPLASRILLAPVLAGAALNRWLRSKRRAPWNEVAPGLYLGGRPCDVEATELAVRGVVRVLDLAAELSAPAPLLALEHASLPVLDLTPVPPATLRRAVDFLRESPGPVYVHCALGLGRSAAVAAAWLLESGRAATVDDAIRAVRSARPGAVFPRAAKRSLEEFERSLNRKGGSALQELAGSKS